MKTRLILLFLVIAAIVFSCKKDTNTTDTKDINYYVVAFKNNTAWSVNSITIPFGDSVEIRGSNTYEALKMKLKFVNTGNYVLKGTQGEYILTTDGTQVLKKYTIRTDTVSSVNITSYDVATRIFEGSFELKLVQYYPASANPEKLSFTSGKLRSAKAILTD